MFALADFFDDLGAERFQVARVSGRNDSFVDDDFGVFPFRAGIGDVGLDRFIRRHLSALGDAGFNQQPGRMADGGDDFVLIIESANELQRLVVDAQKVVAVWNARQSGGRALWFYPTIGAAIAAGVPWLSFSCPACGQVGAVDLRTLDRHPGASISSLIPSGSCRRCSPNAPFARLEMLTAEQS